MRRAIPAGVGPWWSALVQDTAYALRGIRSRPGFTAMIVVTLALGIGANSTMFGVLDRLLLRPPAHIQDPDRLVHIHSRWLASRGVQTSQPYAVYTDFLRNVPDFASVAATTPSSIIEREYLPLGRGTSAARVAGAQVTPSFFPTLGVRPVLGRFFQEDEAGEANPQKLAVIGYGFWQRRFGGRTDVIGQKLEIGADRYLVVGVTPRGFTGAELSDIDVWIPIAAADGLRFAKGPDWSTTRTSQWLSIYARLRPDVTVEHALAQATAAYRAGERIRIAQSTSRIRENADSEVVEFSSLIPGRAVGAFGFGISATSGELRVAKLLGGVALVVLLIACANVANLLLVRAMHRRREIAVRLALGISRRRLVQQLLVEGMLLAAAGALAALGVAQIASGFIRRTLLGAAAWSGSAIDGRMLVFTGGVAVATGLLTSLLPAIQSSHPELTSALKTGVREGAMTRSRTRTTLLVAQAALAVLLLAGAGLFVRSLRRVAELPLGVDVDHALVASIAHRSVGMSNAEALRLYLDFAERARGIPGVTASAVSIGLPFGLGWGTRLFIPGQQPPASKQSPSQYAVTPDYFAALGIRLLMGRPFNATDRIGTPAVAIVNETAARRYWPRGNPVGQCVQVGADTMPCTTVVGVVTNTRRQQLVEQPMPMIYRPLQQLPPSVTDGTVSFFGYTLVVRTSGSPAGTTEHLRRVLQAATSEAPYVDVRPMSDLLGRQTRTWRLGAVMFSAFGGLALVLAAIGLYSVVTFSIAQRLHEYGVRLALGARAADLLRLTLVRGVAPAAAGIGIGIALALASGRVVAGLLFDVSPYDPPVFLTVSAVLLVASVVASLIPARRVTRVDPLIAMRSD